MLSATYRQESTIEATRLDQDPANEWLGRGPSYRLAAEQIRDGALAASGLLVRTVGGPSVYPYQPPGLWESLATRNATKYEQGKGADLYRRSLYTVWKRSSPPPSAISFDAADRLFCTVSRQRTNTPLQSLVLLNDPQYLEASRVLAQRMIVRGWSGLAGPHHVRIPVADEPAAGWPGARAAREAVHGDACGVSARQEGGSRSAVCGRVASRSDARPRRSRGLTLVATTIMNFDAAVYKR